MLTLWIWLVLGRVILRFYVRQENVYLQNYHDVKNNYVSFSYLVVKCVLIVFVSSKGGKFKIVSVRKEKL